MSDYEHCEKHNCSYLIPDMIDCPICYLEYLAGSENQDQDKWFSEVKIDSETINEIIRIFKIGLKHEEQITRLEREVERYKQEIHILNNLIEMDEPKDLVWITREEMKEFSDLHQASLM